MAKLGLVEDDQFELELKNCTVGPSKSINGIVIPKEDRGRGKGNVEVPDSLRKIIADESLTNGRQSAVALGEEFGISPSSVSAYSKGSTSTASYNEPSQTIQNYLTARKNRLTKKALRNLNNALDALTPDKLNGIKARDISSIAKDMSVVAKNMSPDSVNQQAEGPKFVVYAPTIRDERTYETIVVSDNY